MKAIFKNVSDFINEQEEYYSENLKSTTNEDWALDVWTAKNGGWLATARSNTKVLSFKSTARLKGFANLEIPHEFSEFIKAMLVQEYRAKSSGQEALQSTLLVLKRLYVVLKETTLQTHPAYLTTHILEELDKRSMDCLVNYADAGFKLAQLQKVIVVHRMTFTSLNFVCKHNASNKYNTSKNQRKTTAQLKEKVINDIDRSGEDDTISIAAFISLVWLSNNSSNQWENLGLKLMDILIPTGFRISELSILPRDCWIEREIISEKTGKPLLNENGKPTLVHGLKYFGLKKSNTRIHWLEPNVVPVVKLGYRRNKRNYLTFS